jgi:hypothetical protein
MYRMSRQDSVRTCSTAAAQVLEQQPVCILKLLSPAMLLLSPSVVQAVRFCKAAVHAVLLNVSVSFNHVSRMFSAQSNETGQLSRIA